MSGKQFALFKRGKYWYVQFKDPNGVYTTAKSTKCANKHDAEAYAISLIADGTAIVHRDTFGSFADNFFAGDGAWAIDRLSRGRTITPRYCANMNRNLSTRVIPYFGAMKLTDITVQTVKNFRAEMYKKGFSGASINMYLCIVKQILTAAEEAGLIRGIPRIDRVANSSTKKGVLTIEELSRLFHVEWADYRAYAASALSACSGLRMCEVQGLLLSDYFPDEGRILCNHSWDRTTKTLLPSPKNKQNRDIYIPRQIVGILDRVIAKCPHPMNKGSFIFWADKSSAYPVEQKILSRNLERALTAAGISETERRNRHISFHSHRYFINSALLNAGIDRTKVKNMLGHLTDEMSDHYRVIDDMSDVTSFQAALVGQIGISE